jgi:hypothetical protein
MDDWERSGTVLARYRFARHGAANHGSAPSRAGDVSLPQLRIRSLTVRHLVLVAAVALVLVVPSGAAAAARSCPSTTFVRGRLAAVATILNVRDMHCRSALAVVRRFGRSARPGGVGSRFRLGSFSCTVYFVLAEDNKARCVRCSSAFRVDYGS